MSFYLFCCWPGLAALWYRGMARGVLLAVLFCWLCSLLLLSTFVWPEWISVWAVRIGWLALVLTWMGSTAYSHWTLGRLLGVMDKSSQDAFTRAQEEYLRGNWFEAEAILLEMLQRFPRDAEALLLLVGVLRHTQRWQPALRRLDQLESLDSSSPWRFEMARERKYILARMEDDGLTS